MKPATFRLVYFLAARRFVGIAWNYDKAVIFATRDYATYTDARAELATLAAERGVELRWFDGEYECQGEGDLMVPATLLDSRKQA